MVEIEAWERRSGGNGRGRFQPTLHLVMVHQAGLLQYGAASEEDHEIGDAADFEASGQLRVFFRIHFHDDGFAGHVRGGSGNFRRSREARPAPSGPEIHQYGHRRVLHDFIEQLIVNGEGFCEGRQRRLTEAATARTGEKLRGNPILFSAVAAGANDRQAKPPSKGNLLEP